MLGEFGHGERFSHSATALLPWESWLVTRPEFSASAQTSPRNINTFRQSSRQHGVVTYETTHEGNIMVWYGVFSLIADWPQQIILYVSPLCERVPILDKLAPHWKASAIDALHPTVKDYMYLLIQSLIPDKAFVSKKNPQKTADIPSC